MIQDQYHVFAISETDLEHYDEKKPFSFPGYTTYSAPKKSGQKFTRLLLFISEDVPCTLRSDLMQEGNTAVFVELTPTHGKSVLVGTFYREFKIPGITKNEGSAAQEIQLIRLRMFGQQLSKACSENKNIFILGDMNLDLQKKEDTTYYLHNLLREYLSFQGENGLAFMRMGITFQRKHEDGKIIESELDHLLTNCPDEVKEHKPDDFDNSDHKIIMAEIYFGKTKEKKKSVVTRDLREVRQNPKLLKSEMAKQNWQELIGVEDVNEMVKSWTKNIIAALDRVAPKKEKILKNGQRKPNWSPEILKKIKEKNDLRIRLQELKATRKVDMSLQESYKRCRNQCNNLLRSEHRKLMGTHLSENSSMNEVWKSVNKILAPRQRAKPLTIKVGNDKIDDPNKVANELNKWFKQKVDDLVKRIYKPKEVDPFSRLRAKLQDKKLRFKLQPVNVTEVLSVLQDLKKKTSFGLDELSSEMLKVCKEELAGPLTLIINRSICSGVFPEMWKIAKVCPLLKKGDATDKKNYRPVALLCVAAMVLEKIVADQMEAFFESNNLLGEFQFGFRRHRSTISELLTLFETVQEAREENKLILQILYDLSAAFDTVEPRVLIEKLKIYGFDYQSRKWMESYLTGRSQKTSVDGKFSEPVDLCYGTPQGSRLSPLLFIIIMADLDLWTADSKLSNFADDTQSVVIKDDYESLMETAKLESQAVVEHFSVNNLVNNADKAALLFNNKGKAETITMKIAGEELTSVDKEKLLGIKVASNLGWKKHIEYISGKMNQRLSILRRLKNKVPQEKLSIIANAIFTSVARYGIAVYSRPRLHNDRSFGELEKLQVIQNKMFRLLAGKKLQDKVRVESLGKQFGIMSINQMTCYHTLLETFNIINYGSSKKIQYKLLPNSGMSLNLTVPLCKKTTCRAFSYFASRLWNSLPTSIRANAMPSSKKSETKEEKCRLHNFKKEVKKWIWEGGVPFK